MLGSPIHLVRRFFDVLGADPLSESEVAQVGEWLGDNLCVLFFDQDRPDQRHGYSAAAFVAESELSTPDLIRAAALHDIGKRHARLGVIGRSIASVMIFLRLPMTRRMRSYRDHGQLGAQELKSVAASTLVIDFAEHHHHRRPEGFSPEEWKILVMADQPPKARNSPGPPISSAGQ